MRQLRLLKLVLLATAAGTCLGDLVFVNSTLPSSILCVPTASNALQTGFTSGRFTPVSEDFCEPDGKSTYRGAIVERRNVMNVCGLTTSYSAMIKGVHDLGVKNEVSAVIWLYGIRNEIHRIPYQTMYGNSNVGIGSAVIDTVCQALPNQSGGYVEDVIFADGQSHNVTLVVDPNPWTPVLSHPLYFLWFRGLGGAYLFTGITAGKWARQRLRNPTTDYVPEESVSLTILGLHLLVGGFYSSSSTHYPQILALIFLSMMSGTSMATSLLSGFFFDYTRKEIFEKTSKRLIRGGFWAKNKKLVFLAVGFCIALDVVSFLMTSLYVPYFELVIGGMSALFQIICGTAFFSMSYKFVIGFIRIMQVSQELSMMSEQSKARAKGKSSKAQSEMYDYARWLFLSGISMIIYTCLASLVAISGSRVTGLYSPIGWALFWGTIYTIRWLISFSQVKMSKPKNTKKKKKSITVAPATTCESMDGTMSTVEEASGLSSDLSKVGESHNDESLLGTTSPSESGVTGTTMSTESSAATSSAQSTTMASSGSHTNTSRGDDGAVVGY